jgi:hypothetical protein
LVVLQVEDQGVLVEETVLLIKAAAEAAVVVVTLIIQTQPFIKVELVVKVL